MLKQLKVILEIQEYDMKMIRLMRLKKERSQELEHINALRHELSKVSGENGQLVSSSDSYGCYMERNAGVWQGSHRLATGGKPRGVTGSTMFLERGIHIRRQHI